MKFALGRIVATPGAIELLEDLKISPVRLITRHAQCDWSDMSEEDAEANADAIHQGTRIFSAFILKFGKKIWVITEADRSVTTLLLPDEY